jgi:hypothetical protein
MKKFTLLFIAAFMAVLSYANAGRPIKMAHHSEMAKALHSSVTANPVGMKGQAVELPDGVTPQEYWVLHSDNKGRKAFAAVYIAFNGNDVYMQGISTYFPEACIKGTRNGNTITFPGKQQLDSMQGYEFLFQDDDAVFSYDGGVLSLNGEFYTYYGSGENYYYDMLFTSPVMTPVPAEKAATPAEPFVYGIESTEYGDIVEFVVPNVDTEGNGLVSSKLFFQLYYEVIENGTNQVYPVVFKPGEYKYVGEDATYIPFGFTEGYDFYNGEIYLNMNHSNWTKIGIKSIYIGGDEQHETEIQWTEIESQGGGNTPVGGSAEWIASDQGYENAEEVSTIYIGNNIIGTLGQGEGTTTPKYYNNGTSLRMYAGNTLTITSSVPMAQIAFTFDTNNGAKMPDFTVSTGNIVFDGATAVWTGNAGEIVFTVPNITGQQSRIQKIVVGSAGGGTTPTPDLVTPPSTATTETWYLDAVSYNGDVLFPVKVAIDGADMYVQGFGMDYLPDAWVKGTISGNKVTFPAGQFLGEIEDEESVLQCYFLGYDEAADDLCNVEFKYDATNGILTTDHYIFINAGSTQVSLVDYMFFIDITKTAPVLPEPIEAPQGLVTDEYLMTGFELSEDEENEGEMVKEPMESRVHIGFNGNDVYFYGLVDGFWAKGTLSSDGKKITIPANQYMGTSDYQIMKFDYYITALDESMEKMQDLVFDYDAANGVISTNQILCINGSRKILLYYRLCTDVKMTKMVEVAATPADPAVAGFSYDEKYGWGRIELSIPAVDVNGNDLLTTKMYYQVMIADNEGTVAPLKFTKDLYTDIDADMETIPYNFESYDFYVSSNHIVYLNQPLEVMGTWKNIGVKSIYTGGGETHESNIGWYSLEGWYESLGIADVQAEPLSTTYLDLQGRRVDASQKGLLIQQTRMADGTVKTRKVIRK